MHAELGTNTYDIGARIGDAHLDAGRGHRPRQAAAGTDRRPGLTLADRLLAAVLHHRWGLSQVAVAALFGIRSGTINKRIRAIRGLPQSGCSIRPAGHRLHHLDDPCNLARGRHHQPRWSHIGKLIIDSS